jgi:hypothetical protein
MDGFSSWKNESRNNTRVSISIQASKPPSLPPLVCFFSLSPKMSFLRPGNADIDNK